MEKLRIRKKLVGMTVVVIVSLLLGVPAMAGTSLSVLVNGLTPDFDVAPRIEDGRTLVEARAIAQALGADISWDAETNTVAITNSGVYDVMFSYQPGGNMGMPAAADLPIKLDLATFSPGKKLVSHIDYAISVTNTSGEVVYQNNSAHEHEGYHEVTLAPLPEGMYNVEVSVRPTMDTPQEYKFAEINKKFSFSNMKIEANKKAVVSLDVEGDVKAGKAAKISLGIRDENGKPIPHTDNYLLILKDNVLVYQTTNLHSHMGDIELYYTFPEAGEYTLYFSSNPVPMRSPINFKPVGQKLIVNVGRE